MVPDAGNSDAGVARTDAGDADARRAEGTRTFLRAVNIVPDALLTRLGAFEKGEPGAMLAALEAGAKNNAARRLKSFAAHAGAAVGRASADFA